MVETLLLRHFSYFDAERKPDLVVEVEYVEVEREGQHGKNPDGSKRRAYDVFIDHAYAGRIEHVTENTDRVYNRIRVPGKGRKAWGWRTPEGRYHSPGMYERTKRNAVAKLVEYSEGTVRKI